MNFRHSKLWSSFNGLCTKETLSGEAEVFYKSEVISRPWCISNSVWTKENMTMMAHGPLDSLTPILLQVWGHCSHTDFGVKDRIKCIISLINCLQLHFKDTYFIYIHLFSLDLHLSHYRVNTSVWCFKKRQHQWKRQVKRWQTLFEPGLLQWSAVGMGTSPDMLHSFFFFFQKGGRFFSRVYNFWSQNPPW